MSDCTVCTVNFDTDNVLKINLDLFKNTGVRFIVTENSPFKFKGEYPWVTFIDGIKDGSMEARSPVGDYRGKPAGRFEGCLQHAVGLERAFALVDTRWMLILDADFFCPINPHDMINYMDKNKIAILGAHYGTKNQHGDYQQCHEPAINNVPLCYYTLFDLNIVQEPIYMDYRKSYTTYLLEHNKVVAPRSYTIIDAGYPIMQIAHKYRWKSFRVCFDRMCSICAEWILHTDDLYEIGLPLEKYYWNNQLVGLHIHHRSRHRTLSDRQVGHIRNLIKQITCYHPNNHYTNV